MKSPLVKAFVQARMSSTRYPGKVLAPFRGVPLIRHVVRAIEQVLPLADIVVATSVETSDEPLAEYLDSVGVQVYRGSLDDVVDRFVMCLRAHPCEWILRINGDSPVIFPELIRLMLHYVEHFEEDLVTTIFPRSFPKGQNPELIKAGSLQKIASEGLTAEDREHVTSYFYRHHARFKILNVESGDRRLADHSLAVDTIEDLRRLEQLSGEDLRRLTPPILAVGVNT